MEDNIGHLDAKRQRNEAYLGDISRRVGEHESGEPVSCQEGENAREDQRHGQNRIVEPKDKPMTSTIFRGGGIARRQPMVAPMTTCATARAAVGNSNCVNPNA
ncbi:hypothetical protein ABIE78_000367 [Sinorhizobium fredii]|nr:MULTISPECIES: hypothetical protein [Sinorhizobium]